MNNFFTKQFNNLIKAPFNTITHIGQAASDLIQMKLNSTEPVMIARFGSTEIKAIIYPFFPPFIRLLFKKRIFIWY